MDTTETTATTATTATTTSTTITTVKTNVTCFAVAANAAVTIAFDVVVIVGVDDVAAATVFSVAVGDAVVGAVISVVRATLKLRLLQCT